MTTNRRRGSYSIYTNRTRRELLIPPRLTLFGVAPSFGR